MQPESDPFSQLADATPELRTMAATIGLQDEVGPATVAVARRLAGHPTGDLCPLADLLFLLADDDLRILAQICGSEPLRASMAAVAWMRHILSLYGAHPPEIDHQDPAEQAPEQLEQIREDLSALMHRRLPDGFPLPASLPAAAKSPLERAAQFARTLDLPGASLAGMTAALACNEAVQTLAALLPGFGWDYSTGRLQETLGHDLAALAELMTRLPTLRRIVDDLGRLEAVQRVSRRTDAGGRESVVGARIGGELADALPCELALLAEADTEDLFYQRMLERRLLSLELAGVTHELSPADARRGPAIACIDTSGSMSGAPEAVAKALVLAVARRMARERRPLHLLLFGGPGEGNELEISPGSAGARGLLAFLRMSFNAGTDYDTPLLRALQLLRGETFKQADVLIVTDGLCRASARVAERVAEAKRAAGARVLGVVIGGERAGLETFCDRLWMLDPTSPSTEGIDLRDFAA